MDTLDEMLGIDLSDPVQQRAREIVEADRVMWDELLAQRRASGLTLEMVGRRMGISPDAVGRIEAEQDCHLSTLRRYRLALFQNRSR